MRQLAQADTDRLDDAELLDRALDGDPCAFTAIHRRHAPNASAVARSILGSTPAAEDVVQEALLQLWREGRRYSPERGSLRSWILVLVRSRALDQLRRERVRTATAERVLASARGHLVSSEPADEAAGRREETRAVHAGLRGLPREQGEVLGMLYLGGRTQAEIARSLDVPLGTVKGRARLGIGKLRHSLAGAVAA